MEKFQYCQGKTAQRNVFSPLISRVVRALIETGMPVGFLELSGVLM